MKKWACTKRDNVPEDEWLRVPALDGAGHLNADFTECVMDQVRKTDILPASGTKLADVSGMRRSRRCRQFLQWGSLAVAMGGAAVMLFLLNLSVPEPALSSLPQNPPIHRWADPGLLAAKKLGVVQEPHLKISDQGYTVSLQEVVADPTRLVLNVSITDQTGQVSDKAMSMFDHAQLKIRNENGRVIGQLKSISSEDSDLETGALTPQYLRLTYIFPDEEPGDTVVIQGDIHELYAGRKEAKTLAGDWSFSYEADMTRAQDLTVTTTLDEAYTTPAGLNIELEQLVYTPAGVRLEFNTSLTDEAVTRTPEELRSDLGVMYHFETGNGEELLTVNSYKDGGINDTSLGYTLKKTDQAGKMHWTYYFPFLPSDSEDIRFVLDGYYIPVETDDSFTFRPQELKQKPAVFNALGDTLYVHDMKITETSDEPGISGWMKISGEFANKLGKDQWTARDNQGKLYDVIFRGAYTDGETVTFGETDEHTNIVHLIAKDMEALPQELTLTRTITDKRYTDVNWSFQLPGIEQNKALKNQ